MDLTCLSVGTAMKLSSIILGTLLVASSEAWKLTFYGKGKKGDRPSFHLEGMLSVGECTNLRNETLANIPVHKFKWDSTTIGWTDVSNFRAYESENCLEDNGQQRVIVWKGKKTSKAVKISSAQKIRSYQIFQY
jgi:hypothetical protein